MNNAFDLPWLGVAAIAISLLLALLVGIAAMPLGRALSILDHPDGHGGRKLHARVTPLVGGLAVVAVTLACVLLSWVAAGDRQPLQDILTWFAAGVVLMFVVGYCDDRFALPAVPRLLLALLIFGLVIANVDVFRIVHLRFAGQPAGMAFVPLWSWTFTLLCLVGFLNAVNMADGKNGLVIGQAVVWAILLMFRLPPAWSPLLLGLAAALIVLFVFNMNGRLFLGDSGSYTISAVFGLLAILAWNNGSGRMNADDLALIFAVPVFDTLRLMVYRVIRGSTPFTPGRDHLHHYLYARWGWPKPLPWLLLLVALPNLAALLVPNTGVFWLALTFAGYVLMLWMARQPIRSTVAN